MELNHKKLRRSYSFVKNMARRRHIKWGFSSYEEWLSIWVDSGHLHERGRCKNQYVMARFNDSGSYCKENVKIIRNSENLLESHGKRITIDGVSYDSMVQAAYCLGIHRDTLRNRLYTNKIKKYDNYSLG